MKKSVIFVGSSGFPFGSAMIQRQIQLGKSLLKADYNVKVINRKGVHSKSIIKRENIKRKGVYEGLYYFNSSLVPYRAGVFVLRNLLKILGFLNEILLIVWIRFFQNGKYIFNNSIKLKELKYYYFLSKILNITFVYDYVEIVSSLANRNQKVLTKTTNNFDYLFLHYTDKIISISSFLENHVRTLTKRKKMVKIPPIIDFSYIDTVKRDSSKKSFFLFCGSAAYDDLIEFIITSFIKSKAISNKYYLRLVLNGSVEQMSSIYSFISRTGYDNYIEVLTKLRYVDLITTYKSAFALLIPLTTNLQDQARFPFKICEYTASKRPIITTDSGPIGEFFKDKKNALIAKPDNVKNYTAQLNFLIDNPLMAGEIGLNGYALGKNIFNFETYSDLLKEFLELK